MVLVGGTGVAQLLPVLATPFLTRMFEPEEFGVLALFTAIVSVLGVVSCARYELAVTQPKSNSYGKGILLLCFIISCVISLFIFFTILTLDFIGSLPENLNAFGGLIYLIPPLIVLSGFNMAFSYWFVRVQSYSVISTSKIAVGAVTASFQMLMGYLKYNGGLVIGFSLGFLSAFLYFLMGAKGFKLIGINVRKFLLVRKGIIEYKKLPQYSLLGAALDNISLQLPLIMIAKYFNLALTGIFGLAYRMLNLPLYLIASSLYQVLFQKISRLANESPKDIYLVVRNTLFAMSLLCVPFLLFAIFFSRIIFIHVFGEEWVESGVVAETLCFAMAVRFCATVLSCVMALKENVRVGGLWQILNFFTLMFVLSYFSYLDFYNYVFVIMVHDVVLYFFYILIIMRCAKKMGQEKCVVC